MKVFTRLFLLIALLFGSSVYAQPGGYDVFVNISKYITKGDAEKLSAWFDDNLETSVLAASSNSSKNQAKQIMKTFFENYTPRSFDIIHTAGKAERKYALGTLNAGGETFMVTIFVSYKDDGFKIQQLKVERVE